MKKTNIHKLVFAAVLVGRLACFVPYRRFKVRTCSAPCKYNRCSFPWTCMGSGRWLHSRTSQKSSGTWLSPCVPRLNGWRIRCSMLYKYIKKLPAAYVGELFGTSVLGGLLAYPVARFLVGAPAAAITVYILPFFVSCAGGTVLAIVIVTALKKAKVFDNFLGFSKEVRA